MVDCFTLFINDIGACFKHGQCLLHADDLKLFGVDNNESGSCLLQLDFDRLSLWL